MLKEQQSINPIKPHWSKFSWFIVAPTILSHPLSKILTNHIKEYGFLNGNIWGTRAKDKLYFLNNLI